MQEKVSAQYKNEIEMAKAQRDFELKKAAYDIEVNTKKAESEMAYQLQVANDIQLGFLAGNMRVAILLQIVSPVNISWNFKKSCRARQVRQKRQLSHIYDIFTLCHLH